MTSIPIIFSRIDEKENKRVDAVVSTPLPHPLPLTCHNSHLHQRHNSQVALTHITPKLCLIPSPSPSPSSHTGTAKAKGLIHGRNLVSVIIKTSSYSVLNIMTADCSPITHDNHSLKLYPIRTQYCGHMTLKDGSLSAGVWAWPVGVSNGACTV